MHWLLIGYMFLFIHRPFEVWPVLGEVHLERIYMLGMLAFWAIYPNKRWLPNLQHLATFAFAAAVLVCWAMSPWADAGQVTVENYLKLLVFYVLLVTTVHREKTLKQMLIALLGIMAIYLLHSLREYLNGRHTYRMGIARMIGVDATMGDPNTFGASILFVLPFVTVFWSIYRQWWVKLALVGYFCLSAGCILLTGSRSAFIGMLLWLVLTIGIRKHNLRWAVVAVIFGPFVFFALPESLQNRFYTIIDPSIGPKSAQVSGEGRIEGLEKGWELLGEYPFSGVGPGCWRPATRSSIESHSLYGQVMGEMGLLGVFTFAAIVLAFFYNVAWLQRQNRFCRSRFPATSSEADFLVLTARAIRLAVLLMLFSGVFGHNLFRFNWLWYGGFLVIACHCMRQRLRQWWYNDWRTVVGSSSVASWMRPRRALVGS